MKTLTAALLKSGATIQEMNTIRKHVSAIQGGRLAAASRAPVVALIVSDVTGDDPTHIASGPCAPDPTTYGDAIAVLERYDIDAPRPIVDRLRRGVRGDIAETPKPGDRIFRRVENHVIATAQSSLAAASKYFIDHRVSAAILGDTVTGEAREVGKVYAALARQVKIQGNPWKSPIALISGGECTVTVKGRGRGGRCSEFLLSLGVVLDGLPGVSALACDTDGIDGSEDNAGAILTPDTLKRAARKGLNASSMLELNDAYGFFAGIGDLVVTGPTRTNVNDYRAILIE